jgi:hypothetical protein
MNASVDRMKACFQSYGASSTCSISAQHNSSQLSKELPDWSTVLCPAPTTYHLNTEMIKQLWYWSRARHLGNFLNDSKLNRNLKNGLFFFFNWSICSRLKRNLFNIFIEVCYTPIFVTNSFFFHFEMLIFVQIITNQIFPFICVHFVQIIKEV